MFGENRRSLARTAAAVVLLAVGAGAAQQQAEPRKDKGGATTAKSGRAQRQQPSAADIMQAFLQDRPAAAPRRGRSAATKDATAEVGEPDESTLLREGDYLNRRLGRLVREGNWWTFVFEFDDASAAPRIRVLPNRQLERMVLETARGTVDVTYQVSGEITVFESYNYLLVRKAMRFRTTDNLEK